MWLWVSTRSMTVALDLDASGYIVQCAPIVLHWRWQPIERLLIWLRSQGGFRMATLPDKEVA